MTKYTILLTILVCSGCLSQSKIDRILATCPEFVQQNVGEIKYLPVSWGTVMLMSGVTDKYTGEIWLTAWANEHALLHEIAHSVYFRTNHEAFSEVFRSKRGFISIWALNHTEAVAEAFVEGVGGKTNPKINCAMDFFMGKRFDK